MGKIDDILDQVRKTKEVMLSNIDALLVRGDKLDDLQGKAGDIEDEAKLFAEQALNIKKRATSRYLAITFILIGLSIGAIYTIISGYEMPMIILSMVLGGTLGFAINWVRNFFVETFSPAKLLTPNVSEISEDKKKVNQEPNNGKSPSKGVFHSYSSENKKDDLTDSPKQRTSYEGRRLST